MISEKENCVANYEILKIKGAEGWAENHSGFGLVFGLRHSGGEF